MPAVVVVTEAFANLVRAAARARGMAELRTVVLPHPMETRSDDEIRRIAREKLDELRGALVRNG